MKKILHFIIFAFIIFGVYIDFFVMFYSNIEYPMWRYKIEKVKKKSKETKIILGDSKAMAGIRPSILGEEYLNLAVGGGTPIEAYFFLKNYLKRNEVEEIIISFSPSHLEFADVFLNRTLKFDAISLVELIGVLYNNKTNENFHLEHSEYLDGKHKQNNSKINQFFFDLKAILIKLNIFNFYINDINMNGKFGNYKKNKNVIEEIEKNKGNHNFGVKDGDSGLVIEAKNNKGFEKSNIMDFYIKKIFKLAQVKDIKIIYISTPFNKSSYSRISESYNENYEKYFKLLKNEFPEAYWFEKLNYMDDKYFGDPAHLNPKGQTIFSNYIIDNITSRIQ